MAALPILLHLPTTSNQMFILKEERTHYVVATLNVERPTALLIAEVIGQERGKDIIVQYGDYDSEEKEVVPYK